MKKFISLAAVLLCFTCFLNAENYKFTVKGSVDSYNMMRIVNNTKYTDFEIKAYLLEKKGNKDIITNTLGEFTLDSKHDSSSLRMNIQQGDFIGIALPKELENVQTSVSYVFTPIFYIVEVTLSQEDSEIGQEF